MKSIRREYYNNGNVMIESWYKDGMKHSVDGPARIDYNKNGQIVKIEYYINEKIMDELQMEVFRTL